MNKLEAIYPHIAELRRRAFVCVFSLLAGAVVCWFQWQRILDVLLDWPLHLARESARIIYTAPADAVSLSFKIAAYAGLLLASPVIVHQLWGFVSPGLYHKEKRIILPAAFASAGTFVLGVGFCYLTLPYMMQFFTQFSGGRMEAMLQADLYLDFILQLLFVFGLVFELPVVTYVLARLGVLSAGTLMRGARAATVIIFIVAAVFSPPDVFSQMVIAAPLLALYGVSIVVARLAYSGGKG